MAYKTVEHKAPLAAIIGEAFGEYQNLRDEMGDWESNMSSANMDHLPKYDEVSEAQSTLDGFADNEPSDIPEAIANVEITYSEMVNRRKARGPSRDVRLSNASGMLQAVVDFLEDQIEADDDGPKPKGKKKKAPVKEEPPKVKVDKSELESLKDELESVINDAEGVEFPGMF